MAKVPEPDADLALAVGFCNTYDLLEDPPDRLDLPRLRRIAERYGRGALVTRLRNADLPALRRIRTGLIAVFVAPAEEKAAALNAILAGSSARAELTGPAQQLRLAAVGGPAPLICSRSPSPTRWPAR